jgi:hypothetical protein
MRANSAVLVVGCVLQNASGCWPLFVQDAAIFGIVGERVFLILPGVDDCPPVSTADPATNLINFVAGKP